MRLAWFSPVPPVRSGIAGRTAELVGALRAGGASIDVFVDEPVARIAPATRSAHDFVWLHARRPYDLIVYQFGNSSHHDYIWPYALRYPGLAVLHDLRLHHARAAALLREKRTADYRVEFAWDHPDVSPDLAEVAIAGFDSVLYYDWPMVRTLVAASKLTAVHGELVADELRADLVAWGDADRARSIASIRLGEGEPIAPERRAAARAAVRARQAIPADAVVFGIFGGLTPEKRIPQALSALSATLPHAPSARLLLAGAPAAHYDVLADIDARGLSEQVTVTGYLADDQAIAEHLAACDVSLNLRWPTARETSGPWLRALAAGLPTIITDLAHLGDVPSLDPRTWRANIEARGAGRKARGAGREDPVCVAIDILDEDHSLRLAMRRLAADAELRATLGSAAESWWADEHAPAVMLDDYRRVMDEAVAAPTPAPALPAHLRDRGDTLLRRLTAAFGLEVNF